MSIFNKNKVKLIKETYTEFSISPSGNITPTNKPLFTEVIPPGVYEVLEKPHIGLHLGPKTIQTEELLDLPDSQSHKVINEINKFFRPETKEKYKQYGMLYKRGILMYGPAGSGKTSCLLKVANTVIDNGGICILSPDPDNFYNLITKLRIVQPSLTIVVIWEDFHYYVNNSRFLALLDGELQLDNVVYIATTNYIDRIPKNLVSRPSRFATVIEIGPLTEKAREAYLKHKMPDISETELSKWVTKTHNFTIDKIKDLIISVKCFDLVLEEAIERLKNYTKEDEEENEDYYSTFDSTNDD